MSDGEPANETTVFTVHVAAKTDIVNLKLQGLDVGDWVVSSSIGPNGALIFITRNEPQLPGDRLRAVPDVI